MKDILLNTGDDLAIAKGDFVVDDSNLQNIYLLIRLNKTNIKQYPRTCVGEELLLNGTVNANLRREVQLQLQADGYRLRQLQLTSEQLIIEI